MNMPGRKLLLLVSQAYLTGRSGALLSDLWCLVLGAANCTGLGLALHSAFAARFSWEDGALVSGAICTVVWFRFADLMSKQ